VTGFGATDAVWDASHAPDSDFDPGAVYNPDPSLPQLNGHTGAQYATVLHQNGQVTNYYFNFRSEPIAAAKSDVFAQNFPGDAHEVWFAVKDTCAQMPVQSDAVGQALSAPAIGDSGGFVLVEFLSGVNQDHYDPGAASSALLMFGQSGSPSDAPAC
jgi:hypothetical protein